MKKLIWRATVFAILTTLFAGPAFSSESDVLQELAHGRMVTIVMAVTLTIVGLGAVFLFIRYEKKKIQRLNLKRALGAQ